MLANDVSSGRTLLHFLCFYAHAGRNVLLSATDVMSFECDSLALFLLFQL